MYREILPRICSLEGDLDIALYTSGRIRQPLPLHAQIRHIDLTLHGLRPNRIGTQLRSVLPRILYSLTLRKEAIWHSTYYTLPPCTVGAMITPVYSISYC